MTYEEALEITKGQPQPAWFLVDFVAFCHLFDDIHDQDKPITDVRLVSEVLNFIGHFAQNDWARTNFPRLFPQIVSAFNAWLDANNMAESTNERIRLSSDTLKSMYHEVVFSTAFLIGGFEHMRTISQKRSYDYDQKKEVV